MFTDPHFTAVDIVDAASEAQIERLLSDLPDNEADALLYDWSFWARPEQRMPIGDWFLWYLDAGRGFGKTRTGAEGVREWIKQGRTDIALVAEDAKDARDVMVEGPAGILAVCWPFDRAHDGTFIGRPIYEPSKRRITWANGARGFLFSAEDPEELRGPQFSAAWCDELAKWKNARATWDQLMFGLRNRSKKNPPQVIVTTTPRPKPLVKALKARGDCIVTGGSTFDNAANLAPTFLQKLLEDYDGTRLGRQELYAEYLEDVPGALWSLSSLDAHRADPAAIPAMRRIVVAIDPAVSSHDGSDETGIVAVGLGDDRHGYVLADVSGKYTPTQWARKAADLFEHLDADCFVAEVNQGGDMVANTLRAEYPRAPIHTVHTTRGKYLRAEPIAALYEQGRVHHVGSHKALEAQMTAFTPDFDRGREGYSPDRVDALVHGLTEIFPRIISTGRARTEHRAQERAL